MSSESARGERAAYVLLSAMLAIFLFDDWREGTLARRGPLEVVALVVAVAGAVRPRLWATLPTGRRAAVVTATATLIFAAAWWRFR